MSGATLKDGKLKFKGLSGALRIHMHRPLPVDANIRSCVITKDLKGWSISLQIKIPCAEAKGVVTSIGVDVPIRRLNPAATFSGEIKAWS